MSDTARSPETLVDAMTLEEQVSILSGDTFWSVPGNDRLGIGVLRVTDGPNGARGGGSLIGGVKSAAFPVGIAIGASWDPALAQEIGSALADEVKSKGAHVSLSPTCNIHRSVTNGRNFECYSEDPELTAALAVGFITGLQDKRVASTIKHFVANDSEIERTTMSSEVDERTLREIYLRPFEDAVKKAGTWGIMSSYNKLNGTYTAEDHWLLTKVLRQDWGYDGMVVSDWFGSRSCAPTVNAGLDLEMPGPTRDRGDKLIAAVEAGEVSRETVRTRALNMLRLMERVGSLDDFRPFVEHADDRPEHRALIRRAGASAAVLLKNDGILPLGGSGKIAVIGPNAKVAQVMGGGSAQLNPHYMVSPHDGLVAALGADRIAFAEGCQNHRWEPLLTGGIEVEFFDNRTLSGEPVHREPMDMSMAFWFGPFGGGKVDPTAFSARVTAKVRVESTGLHHLGVHAAGFTRAYLDGKLVLDQGEGKWVKGRTFFEEGNDEGVAAVSLTAGKDHIITVEFVSKPADNLVFSALRFGLSRPLGDAEIAEAARVAAGAETAVVFVGRSGEWDTEGSDLQNIALPGRQDELVAAVLKANPRTVVVLQTGGPVELPWMNDAPAILQAWYPGQEAGNAIADVLLGKSEPGGRLPQTFPVRWHDNPARSQDPEVYPGLNGRVRYEEKLEIGYRHYERVGIPPMFAFGHGLSYSSFAISDVSVTHEGGGAAVSLTVTNTGDRAGSTVAQLYVTDDQASVPRPLMELKGFAKLALDAGETRRVTIPLPARAFAYFDVAAQNWRVEAGRFTIRAGFSVRDLKAGVTLEMPEARLPV